MTPRLFCVLLVAIMAVSASASGRAQPLQQPQQQAKVYSATEQLLSRGITLYATDDDSNEAERLFLRVIGAKPSTTKEGEAALYYLGRYYHRNYYMLKQAPLLDRAVLRYTQLHQPVDRAKTPSTWYAEARFYKGLAFLQQGRWTDAYHAVEQIDPRLDPNADLDYLVWSYDKRQLNRRVSTQTLKEEYVRILNAQGAQRRPKDVPDRAAFDAIIRELQGALGRKALSRAN